MATSGEINCHEFVELVTEYLEERLQLMERARFDAHLIDCPYCRMYLEQMQQTICMLGKLTEESMQPEAKQTFLQVFRDWKRS